MKFAMKVIGMAGTYYNESQMEAVGFTNPCYVQRYEPDYEGGRGRAMLTSDIKEALTWDTEMGVFEAWRAVSPKMPVREDGRPNRPLTAYTIVPEAVE